jgi:hypothetical protein
MRIQRILASLSLFSVAFTAGFSQSVNIPYNKDYYHLIERYEIMSGQLSEQFHFSSQPLQRKAVAEFFDTLRRKDLKLSKADRFNFGYVERDNWEWTADTIRSRKSIFNTFYKRPADFYSVDTKDFNFHVNPVLYYSSGYSKEKEKLMLNTRGFELRGMVARKVGFYVYTTDNQAFFPAYVDRYTLRNGTQGIAVPGEGYTKPFKKDGYDFITARGYITFSPVKNIIDVQFGHDKNVFGTGYRSLMLSDFSSNYTFLKLNTKVWKINYTNVFAELNADVYYLNKLMPKKYLAFHHLSVNLGKYLNVGLFESVIYARGDSGKGGFDLNYLNPIIFYRSIEQQLGSDGNAMLGGDFRLNCFKRFSLYGQLVLDEFNLNQLKQFNGYWGNKYAIQGGFKYVNVFGIKNLDLQTEYNHIRPFTYSHFAKKTSYSHYNHPLAHPLGANLKEMIAILRYQPVPRLNLTAKAFNIRYGADTANANFGSDVLKSYNTRKGETGFYTGIGAATTINYLSLALSYQIKHNIWLDLTPVIRIQESSVSSLNKKDTFVNVSFRWNAPQRLHEF